MKTIRPRRNTIHEHSARTMQPKPERPAQIFPLPEIWDKMAVARCTKAIIAANSYKKMYGDMETCSNVSIMSLRIFGARLETC